FKNLLLTNNIGSRVGGDGGAIYLISALEVNIENTRVISNSSIGAGGMWVLWQDHPLTIKDSLFQENTAGFGGGLVLNDFRTQVTIERTEFISNVATLYEAGAAYIRPASNNGHLTMDRVRFIGNQAADKGKALWLNSTTSSTAVEMRLTNLILAHNANPPGTVAAEDDAAIYVSTRFRTVDLSLAHVTAADNPLTNFLYVLAENNAGEQTRVQIANTLVTGVDYAFAGETVEDGTLALTDTNSLLFDIGTAPYHDLGGAVTFSGFGAVVGDPLLDETYHLSSGSAAIDAGVSSGLSHDIDGQYRPQGAAPDIGADEFYQEIAPSGVSISGLGTVVAQSPADFVAEVTPLATTLPMTYVWQATDHEPITQTAGLSDTVSFTWSGLGSKVIQVSATNAYGTVNDSFNLEVIGEPLLAIRKEGPAEALVGSTITYTLTISNEGVIEATGLVITDTVPAHATSVTPLDGGTMPDGDTVQWTALSLAAGAKMEVRFQVTADETLVNEAYAVSAAGGYSASGSEAVTTVFGMPNLALSKAGPASAGSGEAIEYELTVTNNGAIASHDLVISDTLPSGATYLSGGVLVGDVVRFQVPVVAANGGVARLFFSVTASQNIVNEEYEVVDGDGFSAQGGDAIYSIVVQGPRYVATGGNDTLNACTESASPCATIQHAIDVANAGEEVRVAAGTYDQVQIKSNAQGVTFTQIAYIDKGLVLQGGFTTGDWNAADPQNNVTTLDPQG
ncbi:MAG: choice-of-anchor Q domain-containing protein, partial [Candidatus Promineifilaceae bacterium]